MLSVLIVNSPVRYSLFYDGTEDTSQKLAKAIGIADKDRDWYCAEHVIDLAVFELEEQAIVEKKELPTSLPDGEPDYEIALTEQGRSPHVEQELEFWDAE